MNRLRALYRTTLGKKFIVAVTGIVMIGFLIGHAAGNLKIFLPDLPDGTPDINHYAEFLRDMGEPLLPHAFLLWTVRLILLVSLVLHVICVMQLSASNLEARDYGYQNQRYSRATKTARWMMYTGGFLLFFIVVHLLHLTFGVFGGGFEHGKVYSNLHGSFTNILWVIFYVVSLWIVALHLFHGAWSMFQTLGLDNPDRNRGLRRLATVLAVGLFIGFVAVPVAFITGTVGPPDGESSQEATAPEREDPSPHPSQSGQL